MRLFLTLAAIWVTPLAALKSAEVSTLPKPNFIVINIDDLGYADIGPFGSKLNRTPNLDRMAEEGRKFTSFYAAPVCSPSRSSLMTGCYPKRALPIPHVLFPGNDVGLAPEEVTVAEVLKNAGYATGIVGKWHLGDQPEFLPLQQGFDSYFGLPYSNDMGPTQDGVKSNLNDPLPKPKENEQPPLPLMREQHGSEAGATGRPTIARRDVHRRGGQVYCRPQGRTILPLPAAQCGSLPNLSR